MFTFPVFVDIQFVFTFRYFLFLVLDLVSVAVSFISTLIAMVIIYIDLVYYYGLNLWDLFFGNLLTLVIFIFCYAI